MPEATITAFPSEIIEARRAIRAALSIGLNGREAIGVGQEALLKIRSGMDHSSAIHSTLRRIAQERKAMIDPECFDFDAERPATPREHAEFFAAILAVVIVSAALIAFGYWLGAA